MITHPEIEINEGLLTIYFASEINGKAWGGRHVIAYPWVDTEKALIGIRKALEICEKTRKNELSKKKPA